MSEVRSKMINWVWWDEDFTYFKYPTESLILQKILSLKKKREREEEKKHKRNEKKNMP